MQIKMVGSCNQKYLSFFYKEFFLSIYIHSLTKSKTKIDVLYASLQATVNLTWPFCTESAINR